MSSHLKHFEYQMLITDWTEKEKSCIFWLSALSLIYSWEERGVLDKSHAIFRRACRFICLPSSTYVIPRNHFFWIALLQLKSKGWGIRKMRSISQTELKHELGIWAFLFSTLSPLHPKLWFWVWVLQLPEILPLPMGLQGAEELCA